MLLLRLRGTGRRRDENQKGLARLVSLSHVYPSEWYRFLHPAGATDTQSLTPERFPFLSQGRQITLGTFEVFVQVKDAFTGTYKADTLKFALAAGNSASTPATVQLSSDMLSLAPWDAVLRGKTKAFSSVLETGRLTAGLMQAINWTPMQLRISWWPVITR